MINIEKAAVHSQQMPEEAEIQLFCSFTEFREVSGDIGASLLKVLSLHFLISFFKYDHYGCICLENTNGNVVFLRFNDTISNSWL